MVRNIILNGLLLIIITKCHSQVRELELTRPTRTLSGFYVGNDGIKIDSITMNGDTLLTYVNGSSTPFKSLYNTNNPQGTSGDIQYNNSGSFDGAPLTTDGVDINVENNLSIEDTVTASRFYYFGDGITYQGSSGHEFQRYNSGVWESQLILGSGLADFNNTIIKVNNQASAPTFPPIIPANGMMYYNTTTNTFEFRQNNSWVSLGTLNDSSFIVAEIDSLKNLTASGIVLQSTSNLRANSDGFINMIAAGSYAQMSSSNGGSSFLNLNNGDVTSLADNDVNYRTTSGQVIFDSDTDTIKFISVNDTVYIINNKLYSEILEAITISSRSITTDSVIIGEDGAFIYESFGDMFLRSAGSDIIHIGDDGGSGMSLNTQDGNIDILAGNDVNIRSVASRYEFDEDTLRMDGSVSSTSNVLLAGGVSIGGGDVITSSDTIDLKTATESIEFDKLQFDTSSQAYSPYMIFWDAGKKALTGYNDISGFSHNYGYEVVRRVYNNTGATIPNERFVRRTGTHVNDGRVATIALAGISSKDSTNVWGMTTVSIPPSSYGIVTIIGDVGEANNSALAEDAFYCGFAGVPIDTAPPPPYYSIKGGEVLYSDNDSGIYSVNIETPTFTPSPLFASDTSGINQAVTITTQDVYEYLPIGDCNIDNNFGFTVAGDSVQVGVSGYYQIVLSTSFQGNPTTEVWHYAPFINNVALPYKERSTSSSATGDANRPISRELSANDWVSFRIKNTGGTGDPTIQTLAIQILFLHE